MTVLNDLRTATSCLHALLEAVYVASTEIQYSFPNGERDAAAERTNRLIILARDECERIDQMIGEAIEGNGWKPDHWRHPLWQSPGQQSRA